MNKDSFNELAYLRAYPDVSAAVKAGAFPSGWDHYVAFGKSEGRKPDGSVAASREQKVLSGLKLDGLGLEIGPSHNPIAPKRAGFNVHILDHLDANGLREKYRAHAHLGVNVENIEEVDFVWKGEPLSQLVKGNRYDWIIASHVIEHVPDMVSFLQQCEAILKPDGVLALVIPDKRYCFDYFSPLSSTGEFLDAYEEKRTRPTPGKVFDHFANACTKDGVIAWSADKVGLLALLDPNSTVNAVIQSERTRQTSEYIDVHCWRFIPESFRLIISDLSGLRLINLSIAKELPTAGCEFYVTLSKGLDTGKFTPERAKLLGRIVKSSPSRNSPRQWPKWWVSKAKLCLMRASRMARRGN